MITVTKTRNILDLNKFNEDAKAHNSKITYVIKIGDDSLRFSLSSELDGAEHTALDSFVAAFVDTDPEDKRPKIYDLVKSEAKTKHHHNIDYKKEVLTALIPKRTIVKGEVRKVEWFQSLDAQMSPINKVIEVDVVYTRDTTGFATSRVTTRKWINRDESENDEYKLTSKYYFLNPSEMIMEGNKRRGLLVDSIIIPTLTFMTEALVPLGYTQESVVLKGRKFMDDYESEFNKFKHNSSTITDPADPDFGEKSIVIRFRDESKTEYVEWLDKSSPSLGGSVTIRQYLMSEFAI